MSWIPVAVTLCFFPLLAPGDDPADRCVDLDRAYLAQVPHLRSSYPSRSACVEAVADLALRWAAQEQLVLHTNVPVCERRSKVTGP